MLIIKICKDIFIKNLYNWRVQVHSKINSGGFFIANHYSSSCLCIKDKNSKVLKKSLVPSLINENHNITHRNYCDGRDPVRLPAPLSDDRPIMWPSFFKTIHNWMQVNFIIKKHFDPSFNINEFLDGAKQALCAVSHALAREDYEFLRGLVSHDVLKNLESRISNFSPAQKELIAIDKEDVYLAYPYQVGIMFNSNDPRQDRFVEIMVVYHSLRGLQQMRQENREPPINMGLQPEYQKLMHICNYRFNKEFTKGVDSSWNINFINHFMPAYL